MNPFIAQENPLKTSFENIKRSGFSLQSKTQLRKAKMRNEEHLGVWLLSPRFQQSLCSENERRLGFKV